MYLDPKIVLQRELSKRCANNPRYSLRAFAKGLGIGHSQLSLVLAGKRNLSSASITKIGERLGLEMQEVLAMKNFQHKHRGQEIALAHNQATMDLEAFMIISEWYHYALLSLFEVEGQDQSAEMLAKALGIPALEVRAAIERLERAGMIEKGADERWYQKSSPVRIENTHSTQATRRFQKKLMEKAMESLERDPFDQRDHSSMTMAIDPDLIPYARERIREFRRQLTEELENKGSPKKVYNLTVQICPIN